MPDDEVTTPGFRLPSASGIIAKAGQVPVAFMLDLDGDGVPDYREPWPYVFALQAFAWVATTFAKPHTVIYQLGEKTQTDILPHVVKK